MEFNLIPMSDDVPAETLLDLADALLSERGISVGCGCGCNTNDLLKMALDLRRKPPVFKFHAVAECWSLQRIHKELY